MAEFAGRKKALSENFEGAFSMEGIVNAL